MGLESWKKTAEDTEERLHKQGALISGSLATMALLSIGGGLADWYGLNRGEKLKKSWEQGDKSGIAANVGQMLLSAAPIGAGALARFGAKGVRYAPKAMKGIKALRSGSKSAKGFEKGSRGYGFLKNTNPQALTRAKEIPWRKASKPAKVGKAFKYSELGSLPLIAGSTAAKGTDIGKAMDYTAMATNPPYLAYKGLKQGTPEVNQRQYTGENRRQPWQQQGSNLAYKNRFMPGIYADRPEGYWDQSNNEDQSGRYEVSFNSDEESDQSDSGISSWLSSGSSSGQVPDIETEPNLYQKYVLDNKEQV